MNYCNKGAIRLDNTKIDIEYVLEFSVDSPEFLQCCNELISPFKIINKELLREIFIEINKDYCEENDLCEVCRSELKAIKESRGEHFGFSSSESILVCPRCG